MASALLQIASTCPTIPSQGTAPIAEMYVIHSDSPLVKKKKKIITPEHENAIKASVLVLHHGNSGFPSHHD